MSTRKSRVPVTIRHHCDHCGKDWACLAEQARMDCLMPRTLLCPVCAQEGAADLSKMWVGHATEKVI